MGNFGLLRYLGEFSTKSFVVLIMGNLGNSVARGDVGRPLASPWVVPSDFWEVTGWG